EAKAEIGHFVFTRVLRGHDFSFDAPLAETAGNQDAAQALEYFFRSFALNRLGVDFLNFHAAIIGHAAVNDGFIDGFVGIVQLDVFAHDADAHAVLRGDEFADDLLP